MQIWSFQDLRLWLKQFQSKIRTSSLGMRMQWLCLRKRQAAVNSTQIHFGGEASISHGLLRSFDHLMVVGQWCVHITPRTVGPLARSQWRCHAQMQRNKLKVFSNSGAYKLRGANVNLNMRKCASSNVTSPQLLPWTLVLPTCRLRPTGH